MATFNAVMNVNLIGVSVVLNKIDLVGTVGAAQLEVKVDKKVHVASGKLYFKKTFFYVNQP